MALNFPSNPGIGSVYTDTTSGFSYEWDGTLWKSYSAASSSNIKIIDDISGSFNGIGKTFALTSGGVSFIPVNAQSLLISLGGVVQEPVTDYNVSGSNIIFDEAPNNGLNFGGVSLGPAVPVTTIPDGTSTAGALTVSGNLSVLGFTTTKNVYATGIVTASSFVGSLTGTASTAQGLTGSPNITIGNLTGVAATFTGNVSIAGTLTYEDVTNVDSIGLITARSGIRIGDVSIASTLGSDGGAVFSGIVTASGFRGDGSQLTGVVSGLSLRQAGSVVAGGAATTVNFASGATITSVSAGIATITIAAGIQTAVYNPSGIVTTLNLSSAQDHKVTATGITTITVSGGTEGDSHTVRIVNSGIATVGFSTYFLFPSGSPPSFPTASGAISIVSFTVHRVGTAGTQLLAGASLNFS